MSLLKQKNDVIIVGGGIVGMAFALAMAQQTRLSITILESQAATPDWTSAHYHHRVSAITLTSVEFFKQLGIWTMLQAHRVSPFRQIEVWDEATKGHIRFDSAEVGEAVLGFIIENNLVQAVLEKKLAAYSQVSIIRDVRLASFQMLNAEAVLTDEMGQSYRAQLVVAADGAASWMRNQVNIPVQRKAYEQLAIVTTVKTILPHQAIARQVFLPSGPLAFLPLSEPQTASIVWSLPTVEADRLMQLEPADFCQALSKAFSYRLGEVTQADSLHAFPLSTQLAKYYVKDSVVLLGDAAHTIHPMAGQGVNMGLLDAASLAQLLIEADQQQQSISTPSLLRKYERWRKADNLLLLQGVDKIKAVFAGTHSFITGIRKIGLSVMDDVTCIKKIIIRHALGNRQSLPSLIKRGLNNHDKYTEKTGKNSD